ncbi:hypothetical protein V865_004021 [Kwoniella europaea PYCC6329]|uniref:Uncharacterized protein n=1 Tax=Kwoniella europaea PYCC6329 TaxID=1423913 RepID=A0AAX4KH97_9TREE
MSQNVTRTYYDDRNRETFSAIYERVSRNGAKGWGRSRQTPQFSMACEEQEIATLWEPDPAEPLVPAEITNMTQCTVHTDGSVTWEDHIALPDGTFHLTTTHHSVISRGAERQNCFDEAGASMNRYNHICGCDQTSTDATAPRNAVTWEEWSADRDGDKTCIIRSRKPGGIWVRSSGGREGYSKPAVLTTDKTSAAGATDTSYEAAVFTAEHRRVHAEEPGQTGLVPLSHVSQTDVGTQTDPLPSDSTPPPYESKLFGHPELESWTIASGSSADESYTSPPPVPSWWETKFRSNFSRGSKGE